MKKPCLTWSGFHEADSMRMTLSIILASAMWAQAPAQNEPEVSSHEAPITFSSRVNLISVPVVVRDREGRAVGNLRKEDFQVFDKGKLQVITKFSIEKSDRPVEIAPEPSNVARENAPAPIRSLPAPPERYIAYLVDDVHLESGDLLNMRQAMHRHLDESIDPASRAAIVTTSGLVLSDFTQDREKLHAAVNRVQPYHSGINRQQDCPYISHYLADLWINQELYLAGHLFTDPQLAMVISSGTDAALTAAYGEAEGCGPCPPGKDQFTGLPICVQETLTRLRSAARDALAFGDHETSLGLG